jgi:hypothetical protein
MACHPPSSGSNRGLRPPKRRPREAGSSTTDNQGSLRSPSSLLRGRSTGILALCATALTVCGASAATKSPAPAKPARRPPSIAATSPNTEALTRPDAKSDTWVLSGTALVKTITLLNLSSKRTSINVGVAAGATDVAWSADDNLAVSWSQGTSGGLDLFAATDGRLLTEIALAGPALAVEPGAGGRSFWVIEQQGQARSVVEVSTSGVQLGVAVPVSPSLTAIASFSDNSALWGLLSNGTIEEIELPSGRVTTAFSTGQPASALVVSPSGDTAYVLRSALAASNAAAVDLATQSVTHVYPAPAHSIDMVLSGDRRRLYFAASTAEFGNIQTLELPA